MKHHGRTARLGCLRGVRALDRQGRWFVPDDGRLRAHRVRPIGRIVFEIVEPLLEPAKATMLLNSKPN
jgi:hypothetical protein